MFFKEMGQLARSTESALLQDVSVTPSVIDICLFVSLWNKLDHFVVVVGCVLFV